MQPHRAGHHRLRRLTSDNTVETTATIRVPVRSTTSALVEVDAVEEHRNRSGIGRIAPVHG